MAGNGLSRIRVELIVESQLSALGDLPPRFQNHTRSTVHYELDDLTVGLATMVDESRSIAVSACIDHEPFPIPQNIVTLHSDELTGAAGLIRPSIELTSQCVPIYETVPLVRGV